MEEIEKALSEETAIVNTPEPAVAKFVEIFQKVPSLADNIDKLKVVQKGSFFSIILTDKRGHFAELARTNIRDTANKMIPQIQDAIVKIVSNFRKQKGNVK